MNRESSIKCERMPVAFSKQLSLDELPGSRSHKLVWLELQEFGLVDGCWGLLSSQHGFNGGDD